MLERYTSSVPVPLGNRGTADRNYQLGPGGDRRGDKQNDKASNTDSYSASDRLPETVLGPTSFTVKKSSNALRTVEITPVGTRTSACAPWPGSPAVRSSRRHGAVAVLTSAFSGAKPGGVDRQIDLGGDRVQVVVVHHAIAGDVAQQPVEVVDRRLAVGQEDIQLVVAVGGGCRVRAAARSPPCCCRSRARWRGRSTRRTLPKARPTSCSRLRR